MTDRFRITLAQMNPTVGDLAGNAALARRAWEEGKAAGADFVALIAATTAPDKSRTGAATLHNPLSIWPSWTTVWAFRSVLAFSSTAATSRPGLSAINRPMSTSGAARPS